MARLVPTLLRPVDVPVLVTSVFFKGGERLDVHARATVCVSLTPEVLENAVERFLGEGSREIVEVAANTLERHLRSACARAAPEKLAATVGAAVRAEAPHYLRKLGLELRSFVVQKAT